MPKGENVGNMVILIGIDVNEWVNNEEDDWRYDDFEVYKAYMHKWVIGRHIKNERAIPCFKTSLEKEIKDELEH